MRSGARAAAGCRGRRRCSSARGTARRRAGRVSHAAAPPSSRRARRSARRCVVGCAVNPAASPSRLERVAVEPVERHDVGPLRRARRRGADRLADALDRRRRRARSRTATGVAGVDPAVALAACRAAAARCARRSKPSSASAIASASSPPGARWARRCAGSATRPAVPPSSWTSASARCTSAKRAPASREVAAPCGPTVCDRPAGGLRALVQRRQQLGVDVERDDLVPGAREVQRHAPAARPDVEDRTAGGGGQLAPQRQVRRVAAALEVVPDHLGSLQGRPRSSPVLRRAPRRASSSRSSSIAV